ncbi:hypothetical protein F8388_000610 [Cannabis sativa]|nr:hypothetical protein F8388_000610 [Cannabis sativa]
MKITGFGIACKEAYCDALIDDPGIYRWMALEIINHKSYGQKVDVYSFGLMLWESVTGTIPYKEMNPISSSFCCGEQEFEASDPWKLFTCNESFN